MHVVNEILENVLGAESNAILVAFEHAKESARSSVKVHHEFEQILRAGELVETVVAELDLGLVVRHVVGQVHDELFERLARIEHDLVDVDAVQIADELVGEAQRRIEVSVGRHAPYVDHTRLGLVGHQHGRPSRCVLDFLVLLVLFAQHTATMIEFTIAADVVNAVAAALMIWCVLLLLLGLLGLLIM